MSDSPASRMLQSVQAAAQPATQQWLQPSSDDNYSEVTTVLTPQPVASSISQPNVVPASEPKQVSDQQKLDTFESLLSEMDTEKQSVSAHVDDAPITDTQSQVQQPVSPVGYSSIGPNKEQAPGMVASAELPGGMQYVESEPNPEIPEEVESFLQKVEERPTHLPQEIVIAAQQHAAANTPRNLPQDVKILPVTQAQMEEGKKKNSSFSIKWLVTFSQKLTGMFKGKAVYRQE